MAEDKNTEDTSATRRQGQSKATLSGQEFRTPPVTNTTAWLEKYVAWAMKALDKSTAP
jgi:hypothetical protein